MQIADRAVLRCLAAGMTLCAVAHVPTAAQDAASVAGTYCLRGVHEVGSCIRLSADGKFEYFLAYGAYDENAEGTWRLENGAVVATTPAYDQRPSFVFKRMQASEDDGFDVIVETANGKAIAGVDVNVTCDGSSKAAGITQASNFAIDCKAAPSAIALSLPMFNVAPQSIDVAAPAGSEKTYVFAFEPGNLGKKRFDNVSLRLDGDALEMTYASSPVEELNGKPFRYVRENE